MHVSAAKNWEVDFSNCNFLLFSSTKAKTKKVKIMDEMFSFPLRAKLFDVFS
jgi:hypothetical protein